MASNRMQGFLGPHAGRGSAEQRRQADSFLADLLGSPALHPGSAGAFEAFEAAEAEPPNVFEPVPTTAPKNTIFEFRATNILASDPLAFRTSLRDKAVEILAKLEDLGIRNTPVGRCDAYVDAIAWNESAPMRAGLRTCPVPAIGCINSSCGLLVRSLWRLLGVRHALLAPPYKVGSAMANLRALAKLTEGAYKDVKTRADLDAANVQKGDVIFIDKGSSQHMFTVVDRQGDTIVSIDGGQTANGDGGCCSIQRRTRTLHATERRFNEDSRPVTGVVKLDRLPFTAPLIDIVRPRPMAAPSESEAHEGGGTGRRGAATIDTTFGAVSQRERRQADTFFAALTGGPGRRRRS